MKNEETLRRARSLIPGQSQLVSKRADRFCEGWPAYFSQAQGARVWDLDGREYLDFSHSGVGACPLGYADPKVDAAVKRVVTHGSATTLNPPEEIELAELLCQIHPWAQMARFARGGGEAMAIAVRIARAFTGRTKVAFSGYHGWHDWFLAGDSEKPRAGVPPELDGTAMSFDWIAELPDDLAAVVCEVQREEKPDPAWLAGLRAAANIKGAVLIFDEITSGMRLTVGGVHRLYMIEPDIAVFAKAIGNGFPISAVIGREDVMRAAERTFISSTAWSERIGPTAALATIRKFSEHRVHESLIEAGDAVQGGWDRIILEHGIDAEVGHPDFPPISYLRYSDPAMQRLHCRLMLERGYLDNCSFYATYAHTPERIRRTEKTESARERRGPLPTPRPCLANSPEQSHRGDCTRPLLRLRSLDRPYSEGRGRRATCSTATTPR